MNAQKSQVGVAVSTVDVLKAARDEVEKGWHQGFLTNSRGDVCAIGALHRALYGVAVPSSAMVGDWTARDLAYEALQSHLPDGYTEVSAYNDAETTTKQDILDLFSKTLADLGGLL